MRKGFLFFWAALFGSSLLGVSGDAAAAAKEVSYKQGGTPLTAHLCEPEGAGPFPVVIYNHGGVGDQIGGAPRQTCEALGEAGFVGFSPYRKMTAPLQGQLGDVMAALEYVKGLGNVDSRRIGMIGFSSGGHLALRAAARSPEIKAAAIFAAAPGGKGRGAARVLKEETRRIKAPVLFLVAENDHAHVDHVKLARELYGELQAGGGPARLLIYPPYGSDGHQMFFEVGSYWRDVEAFLRKHLGEN